MYVLRRQNKNTLTTKELLNETLIQEKEDSRCEKIEFALFQDRVGCAFSKQFRWAVFPLKRKNDS